MSSPEISLKQNAAMQQLDRLSTVLRSAADLRRQCEEEGIRLSPKALELLDKGSNRKLTLDKIEAIASELETELKSLLPGASK